MVARLVARPHRLVLHGVAEPGHRLARPRRRPLARRHDPRSGDPRVGGVLGVFEAAGRAAVASYGASPAAAVSAAVALHAVNTVPLVALGVVGLVRAARLRGRRSPPGPRPPAPRDLSAGTVSVVIPCLDEETTIGRCVRSAWDGIRAAGVDGEVIVVDNGSTDRSAELAQAAGAAVVREPERGYGSAYLAGMRRARGGWILMGDGDGTYDFGELPRFLAAGRDLNMVVGSRLLGRILPGAMPWHHRFIGNPLLTGMLNLLFGAGVSDAHCGLRMVRREAADRIGLRTTGMEFASEMVIQAAAAGLVIAETPITYGARPAGSRSKLRRKALVRNPASSIEPTAAAAWRFNFFYAVVLTGNNGYVVTTFYKCGDDWFADMACRPCNGIFHLFLFKQY